VSLIPADRRTIKLTPISLMKALKNPVEVNGMINAHIRDAVALCDFFAWLEEQFQKGKRITEISAADKLLAFRA
jgi:Xaa-Pro aminopeptidase